MDRGAGKAKADWTPVFLEALGGGSGVQEAAEIAGVAHSTAYDRRASDEAFRLAWDEIRPVAERRKPAGGPASKRDAKKLAAFLDELALTSNVAAAAAVAGVSVSGIYRLRREDPDFARRWYEALAEGYDNLEMEMLRHLRSGESGDKSRGSFDTATALRCLTAHRESVAREKGRRTLAQEAATIASINAKIDALRANGRAGDKAMRAVRAAKAKSKRRSGGVGGSGHGA